MLVPVVCCWSVQIGIGCLPEEPDGELRRQIRPGCPRRPVGT